MENQRIRLSKSMLKTALLSLLKEKKLEQITIYELCATAQINRTTFYKYYGSQSDLLEDIIDDFFMGLDSNLTEKQMQNVDGLPYALTYLYEHKDTFNVIIKSVSSQDFVNHLFSLPSIQNVFQAAFDADGQTLTQDKYLRKFLSHGLLAIFTEWLSSANPEPVQEITEMLMRYREIYLNFIFHCSPQKQSGMPKS